MLELTEEKTTEVLESKGRIALDFYGDWCGPCKTMMPVYDEIDKESSDITFYKVNVDNLKELLGTYAVRSIPTLIVLEDGKEIGRIIGSNKKDIILDKISKM